MARPSSSGQYTAPAEIQALKPKDVRCSIKVVHASNKHHGSTKHYYVCEDLFVTDEKNPNRKKRQTGKTIGKIEGGKFVPNNYYIGLKKSEADLEDSPTKNETSAPEIASASEKEIKTIKQSAINMNLDMFEIDLQIKNYGEYAMVLESTSSVLKNLEKHFSDNDARMIYAMSIIHFIEEYTPASYMKDLYDQSVLSNKWPSLAISENKVGEFLVLLGTHPLICSEYSQDIITQSSGMTAIDGHVVLSCSRQNDLADYGNKYHTIGNKQMNMLQAYDVENCIPLASKVYEGGLPDKTSVQDLLSEYSFPNNTCFLVDMGFYSEEDLGLYREGNNHFVIPVPENTSISKAMRSNLKFTGRFTYTKTDENGASYDDIIEYRESTVKELENLYQTMIDNETDRKNAEIIAACPKGEKPKLIQHRKIQRSLYPDDRVIMCRDSDMHEKMVQDFKEQIGTDKNHTEERLAEVAPFFGLILLRTNFTVAEKKPSEIYHSYKKRWRIETHYNFLENTIKFCGLKQENYYAMQGLSFLTVTFGQIKSAYMKKLKSAEEKIGKMSIKESLAKAGRIKVSQHKDKTWHANITVKKNADMFQEMGVDISGDLKKLALQIY